MSAATAADAVPRLVVTAPILPLPPKPFVGRGEQIVELAKAFEQGPGAIICGFAGMGKTSLALYAAHRQSWRFHDGILWFPLAGGRIGFLDLITVHLGVAPGTPTAQLLALLDQRHCLLLLDSFEDAPDSEAALGFLANLPANGCRALITTRERVTLKGWKFVELLELPPSEAQQLFWELLTQRPRDAKEAAEAETICVVLGGHPLALELAAGQRRDFRTLGALRLALEQERERLLQDPTLAVVEEKRPQCLLFLLALL